PILRTQALAGGAGHHCGGVGGSPGSAAQLPGPSLLLGVIMVSIDVHGACVDFPIFDAKTRSLKKAVLGTVGRAGGKIGVDAKVPIIEALRNITISLRHGDRVGLIGHNGAGKSTLLRLLSGIYEPTRGVSRIVGKVAPVFDLGVGMDPEISGYENIVI